MLGWELPPHNSGGLGVACFHMAKALADKGAKIDFVIPYTADHSDIDFMNIHCATNLTSDCRYGFGAYDSKLVSDENNHTTTSSSDLMDIRSVQKHYISYVENLSTSIEPDVIHVHDWLTIEAGIRAKELTNAPLIVHVHATEFDRSGGANGNPLVTEIEYQGLMAADRIIAVSAVTKEIIIKRYGIPADKIEVVHNAIDVSDFNDGYVYDTRTYKYLETLRKEGYTIISTVTRFTVQKGLTHLIRAAAKAISKYDKLAFLLVGDGEQRDELIGLTAKLGISDKVFFTGFIRGKQWRDAYSVSDVFVMSSVSEPFGLTALEAAYHDNALIISKQSGVNEILSSVMQYDHWDEDRLANQIIGIATSPVLKQTLQRGVKNEYDRLSWHDVAEKCIRIYHSMIGATV